MSYTPEHARPTLHGGVNFDNEVCALVFYNHTTGKLSVVNANGVILAQLDPDHTAPHMAQVQRLAQILRAANPPPQQAEPRLATVPLPLLPDADVHITRILAPAVAQGSGSKRQSLTREQALDALDELGDLDI